MCKGFELDEPQKSGAARMFSRIRAGLTMFVIGLHSGRSRIPERYDPNNRIL